MVTKDLVCIAEVAISATEKAQNAIRELREKEKSVGNGRKSEDRQDALKTLVGHLGNMVRELNELYG